MIRNEWNSLFRLAEAESNILAPLPGIRPVEAAWEAADACKGTVSRLRVTNPGPEPVVIQLPLSWASRTMELPPHRTIWRDFPAGWDPSVPVVLEIGSHFAHNRPRIVVRPAGAAEHLFSLVGALPVFRVAGGVLRGRLMLHNHTQSKMGLTGKLQWKAPAGRGHVHAFRLRLAPGLHMKAVEADWEGPLEPGLHTLELTLEGHLDGGVGESPANQQLAQRQSALLWVDTSLGEVDTQSMRLSLQVREAGHVDLEVGLRRLGGRQNCLELVGSQEDADLPRWHAEPISPTQTRQEHWSVRLPVQQLTHVLHRTPNGWGVALRHTNDAGTAKRMGMPLPDHSMHALELTMPRLPLLGPCQVVVAPRKLLTQDEHGANREWSTCPEGTSIRFSFPLGLSEERRVGPWFLAPRVGGPVMAGHARFRLTYELFDWLELRLTPDHQQLNWKPLITPSNMQSVELRQEPNQQQLSLHIKNVSGCRVKPDWKLAWEGQEVIDTGHGHARLVSGDYAVATMLRAATCTIRWGSRSWVAHVNWFVRTIGNGVRDDQFVLARLVEGKA